MSKTYDLIALGTGTGAKYVAKACRLAGWRVAVVDCLPYGGTCALRGCDPKKALWSVADAFATARALQPAGIEAQSLRLDWPKMMAFKRSFTDPVPDKRETQFGELDIDMFHGTARRGLSVPVPLPSAMSDLRLAMSSSQPARSLHHFPFRVLST